jgi:hypothetical protein
MKTQEINQQSSKEGCFLDTLIRDLDIVALSLVGINSLVDSTDILQVSSFLDDIQVKVRNRIKIVDEADSKLE